MQVASFEKVSFEQFASGIRKNIADASLTTDECILEMYSNIRMPARATTGSAGYDFFAPFPIVLQSAQALVVPTGIRVRIDDGWFLAVFPRSGLGFKFRLQLNNTVGIIDSDYYFADNEGHIFIKIFNDSREDAIVHIERGGAFAQGIFLPYGLCRDDDVQAIRTGGLGSTGLHS